MWRYPGGARAGRAIGALVVVLALGALGAPGAFAFSKSTYRVAVTQPDAFGQPVTLETDVYLPGTPPPAPGYPLIEVFHGGGSNKDNPYDSSHAAYFADHGYASILYSQRGHGNSDGETAIAGPKEMHDLFDVTAWALGLGDRGNLPPHPDFHIDASRIGLTGYSQGGLHTNLGEIWSPSAPGATPDGVTYNPYGISFKVLEPANTPDYVFDAIVPHDVVKLSFGAGILAQSYLLGTHAHLEPEVAKWTATTTVDQPQLYGGSECDLTGHDSLTSLLKTDWAFRSVGCFADREPLPTLWAQAFDDALFPPEMAIEMWRRLPGHADNRLYLSMGGHGAPAAAAWVEQDRLDTQLAYFNHALLGAPLNLAPVTFYTRDPTVAVPSSSYQWPDQAWSKQTDTQWPPKGSEPVALQLSADGRAVGPGATAGATSGALPLQPLSEDERNDSVAAAAMSATPLGTSPVPSAVPATSMPGFVAGFASDPFTTAKEISGEPSASLNWTPAGPDTQLVVELFDQAPDGTLTLLTRGVQGARNQQPGQAAPVRVNLSDVSAKIPAGHRVLVWVMAGDLALYKPYADLAGGILSGGTSSLTLPMRSSPTSPAPSAQTPLLSGVSGQIVSGKRATALKKCKHKRSHKARKKCRKRANKLPV